MTHQSGGNFRSGSGFQRKENEPQHWRVIGSEWPVGDRNSSASLALSLANSGNFLPGERKNTKVLDTQQNRHRPLDLNLK